MHLFLEGPVKTGKSTLIRECLSPYREQLGGFSSQRLWQDGKPCGYRLTEASDFRLDAPYDSQATGIFTYQKESISRKDPTVFETCGVNLLRSSTDAPLILLDEIGGSELLVPAFSQQLYQTLAGPIPCIGVLKLSSKAKFMTPAAGYPGEVADYNRRLREDLIEKFDAVILSFSLEEREDLREKIGAFLGRIF